MSYDPPFMFLFIYIFLKVREGMFSSFWVLTFWGVFLLESAQKVSFLHFGYLSHHLDYETLDRQTDGQMIDGWKDIQMDDGWTI